MENANVKEARPTGLAERVVGRLAALKMNKAELAIIINLSRPMVSQYLSGKYTSNPATIEKALEKWLAETEPVRAARPGQGETAAQGTGAGMLPEKKQKLMSSDFLGVMSVCQSCQDDMGLGIIVGRSGYGKTYALRTYAKMDRVAYIECDDTMGCKDLLEAIEAGLGMVRASYGSVWKRVNKIRDFLNVNGGYLIIIDEADKLINKYTVAKMEILRGIFDQADVGIVIAGEPKLESDIKTALARFANRVDFYYKLHGLSEQELGQYLEGWDISEAASRELALRAFGARNGCFRLLDRTLNNVLRVLRSRGECRVTKEIMEEASGMMMF